MGRSMYACHKCDVPQCINPKHIFPGTASENTLDSIKKGRANTKRRVGFCDKFIRKDFVPID